MMRERERERMSYYFTIYKSTKVLRCVLVLSYLLLVDIMLIIGRKITSSNVKQDFTDDHGDLNSI